MREAEGDILVELKKEIKKMYFFFYFGDDKTGLAGLNIMILLQKAYDDINDYNDDDVMASLKRTVANIMIRGY